MSIHLNTKSALDRQINGRMEGFVTKNCALHALHADM